MLAGNGMIFGSFWICPGFLHSPLIAPRFPGVPKIPRGDAPWMSGEAAPIHGPGWGNPNGNGIEKVEVFEFLQKKMAGYTVTTPEV